MAAKLPEAHWQKWLRGDPVAAASDEGPECTVYAFYSQLPHLLVADAAYLAELQGRYAGRGLRVVVAVADEQLAGIDLLKGCSVVLDDEMRTERGWLTVNREYRRNVVVAAKDTSVTFLGRPGAGLADGIEHTLAGTFDPFAETRAYGTRLQLPAGFDDAVGKSTVQRLLPLVQHAPRDGLLNGLLYLTYATKSNDQDAAQELLLAAVPRLANDSRALSVFADLVLRGDANRTEVVAALREPLQRAAKAAKADPAVQLAYLRVLLMAHDGREAGRQAMRCRKRVMATAEGCLDYATLLTRDENPQIHRDLATIALDKAAELGADKRLVAAARYVVVLRCAENTKAAKAILNDYLKNQDIRAGLNNDCWYFMTQLPTMGRFDWFAAALAERMLEERDSLEYFEFDTAALAMFLVGRVQEAVELQEAAVEKGGGTSAEYRERLARYKAHLAPAPR